MKKLIFLIPLILLTLIQISFDFIDSKVYMLVFPLISQLYTALFYLKYSNKKINLRSFLVILVVLLLFISYFPYEKEAVLFNYSLPFEGWLFIIVVQIYIFLFRMECFLLQYKELSSKLLISFIGIVTFLVVGNLLEIIPSKLYLFTLIYAIQIAFLFLVLIKRETNTFSYFLALSGVAFSLLGSFLFSYLNYVVAQKSISFSVIAIHNLGHFLIISAIVFSEKTDQVPKFSLLVRFLKSLVKEKAS